MKSENVIENEVNNKNLNTIKEENTTNAENTINAENTDAAKTENAVEAVKDSTRSVDEIKEASCVLAHVAVLQKDAEALLKYSLKDAATEMCSEMCCELGEYYYGKEDYDEAIVWFYNAAYECASIIDIKTGKEIPRLALAKCYKALGNEEQAADYEKEAAEIEKGE